MRRLTQDLSIYNKFDFERPPIAVKFLHQKPEEIEVLDKTLAFCEMFKEAQQRETPFYFSREHEDCSGKMPLGWIDTPPWAEAGQIGEKFEIFQEPRANHRIYQHFPKFSPGVVNYVAYSRLDQLTFDPDLLILVTKPSQAEIILRAMSYSTGEVWQPRATSVLGCSWLYVYPYMSGKVNYMMTGMHFGMKAREVYPEGLILISIPYNWIPTITQNLAEMKWVLPAYAAGREAWMKLEEKAFKELENGQY